MLHVAQVRGVVVDVVLEEVDLVRREGDAQLGDDAVLRAVDDLGRGAEEDDHVDRAALLRDEKPIGSVDEARLCELAAVLPSSLVEHLHGPLDAVEVGRELRLRRSAQCDVPEHGEEGCKVGSVLEREDDGTRRHGGAAKRGERIRGRTGRRLFTPSVLIHGKNSPPTPGYECERLLGTHDGPRAPSWAHEPSG